MKGSFIIALLVSSSCLTTAAGGQASIECSSTRKGDESLTVCTGPDRWKSVLRCNSSGCTSKTGEDIDYTAERLKEDEQSREICKLEIAQTMKGQQINYRPSYCERLSTSDSIFGNPEN